MGLVTEGFEGFRCCADPVSFKEVLGFGEQGVRKNRVLFEGVIEKFEEPLGVFFSWGQREPGDIGVSGSLYPRHLERVLSVEVGVDGVRSFCRHESAEGAG